MICSSPPLRPDADGINTNETGTCRQGETCYDADLRGDLPVAWCVSGHAFVTLSNMVLSNYNQANKTNSTHLNVLSSELIGGLKSDKHHGSIWKYLVNTGGRYQEWSTFLVLGKYPRRLLKARQITIVALDRCWNPSRMESCSDCSWLTYDFPPQNLLYYLVFVQTPRDSEPPSLMCVDGLS